MKGDVGMHHSAKIIVGAISFHSKIIDNYVYPLNLNNVGRCYACLCYHLAMKHSCSCEFAHCASLHHVCAPLNRTGGGHEKVVTLSKATNAYKVASNIKDMAAPVSTSILNRHSSSFTLTLIGEE